MKTLGIERERFIINQHGDVVPEIGKLLPRVHKLARKQNVPTEQFTFELFAGQIEDRTPPCEGLEAIETALLSNDVILMEAARDLDLSFLHAEYIEKQSVTEFKVNPFDRRHQDIWESISEERRVSASLVAAIHVHISASDQEAVTTLNRCRKSVIQHLIDLGDHSSYRRTESYQKMAKTDGIPPLFANFREVLSYIDSNGGEKNVWDLVRYKPSTKTIEFRMFGATPEVSEILGYIQACREVSGM